MLESAGEEVARATAFGTVFEAVLPFAGKVFGYGRYLFREGRIRNNPSRLFYLLHKKS